MRGSSRAIDIGRNRENLVSISKSTACLGTFPRVHSTPSDRMKSVRARRREATIHMFSQLRRLPPFPRKRRTQADNVSTRTCVATYVHARSAPWWICRYGWRASTVDLFQLLRRPLKWTCWRHPCVSWIPQTICSRLTLQKLSRLELRRFEQRAEKNSAPATRAFSKAHRIFWLSHLLPLQFQLRSNVVESC